MYLCRLQEHIEVSSGREMTLEEISEVINKNSNIDTHVIDRAIKKVFLNLVTKRRRNKSKWTSISIVYPGICWRTNETQPNIINFESIPQFSADFFTITKSDTSITLGHILNFTINYNKVVIEVVFQNNLEYFFNICGMQKMKPKMLGMNNKYFFERNCILGILDGIRNFKVCHGISRLHFEYDTSEKDIIKEIFTITGDENSEKTAYSVTAFSTSGLIIV